MREARTRLGAKAVRGLACALMFAWACSVVSSPAKGQSPESVKDSLPAARLLNAKEGRSIADVAGELENAMRGTQDCSHLVHQVYASAGFEYPYASSFEIYAGNMNFERVRRPQPGDLVVWPGHVGIVVDPLQHSFYSLVTTGWEAQDYQGPYWKSRGRPRFYRYKVESDGVMSAARASLPAQAPNETRPRAGRAVIEERASARGIDSNRPPRAVSETTKVSGRSQMLLESPEDATALQIPSSILIAQGNKPPTREEVAEGISELSNTVASLLRSEDPWKLQAPLVVVEQFKVDRVEVKHDRGWARLEVESKVAIAGGSIRLKRQKEKVRWELRRTESGWEAVAPVDRNYVPHDVAVKNLATQLARLTGSDGTAAHKETILQRESRLANLLSMLLQSK